MGVICIHWARYNIKSAFTRRAKKKLKSIHWKEFGMANAYFRSRSSTAVGALKHGLLLSFCDFLTRNNVPSAQRVGALRCNVVNNIIIIGTHTHTYTQQQNNSNGKASPTAPITVSGFDFPEFLMWCASCVCERIWKKRKYSFMLFVRIAHHTRSSDTHKKKHAPNLHTNTHTQRAWPWFEWGSQRWWKKMR